MGGTSVWGYYLEIGKAFMGLADFFVLSGDFGMAFAIY